MCICTPTSLFQTSPIATEPVLSSGFFNRISQAPILHVISLLRQLTGKKTDEAAENRNYLTSRMTDEINEIIRVLQLTTYDEDEWDADNLTCMKRAQVSCFTTQSSKSFQLNNRRMAIQHREGLDLNRERERESGTLTFGKPAFGSRSILYTDIFAPL